MSFPKTLYAKDEIDFELGYRYRYIYGLVEKTIFHTHDDYYEIFITLSDNVSHIVNNTTINLPKNSCVFIRPCDKHCYDFSLNKDFRYINIALSVQTIRELFQYLSDGFPSQKMLSQTIPPIVTLKEEEMTSILTNLRVIDATNWKSPQQKKFKMRLALIEVFEKFTRSTTQKSIATFPPLWLIDFSENLYLDNNLTKGIDEIIKISGKSRTHLARTIKKCYNKTLSEFINDIRLDLAKNQLESGNVTSMIDLCYICGFENLGYFYKLFTKKFGVPPKKFQKHILG